MLWVPYKVDDMCPL